MDSYSFDNNTISLSNNDINFRRVIYTVSCKEYL